MRDPSEHVCEAAGYKEAVCARMLVAGGGGREAADGQGHSAVIGTEGVWKVEALFRKE